MKEFSTATVTIVSMYLRPYAWTAYSLSEISLVYIRVGVPQLYRQSATNSVQFQSIKASSILTAFPEDKAGM